MFSYSTSLIRVEQQLIFHAFQNTLTYSEMSFVRPFMFSNIPQILKLENMGIFKDVHLPPDEPLPISQQCIKCMR